MKYKIGDMVIPVPKPDWDYAFRSACIEIKPIFFVVGISTSRTLYNLDIIDKYKEDFFNAWGQRVSFVRLSDEDVALYRGTKIKLDDLLE